MPTDKISKFDVDDSIFTKNNPPTPNDVSAVAWLGSLSLEQVTDATYPINYEGSIGTEIASSIGLDSTFYYIKYFAYTVASGYGTMIAIPLQYNHIIPKFRTSDGTLWTDWTTGYLPLTGGHLNGNLTVPTYLGFHNCEVADYGMGELQIRIKDRTNNANIRYISMDDMTLMSNMSDALKLVDFKDGYYTSRKIFGEHNKPTVTYTGNGSSTRRFVNVGGIGKVVCIESSESNNWALVTKQGVVIKKGTTLEASNGAMWYEPNATLEFNTAHEVLNKSGVIYTATLL